MVWGDSRSLMTNQQGAESQVNSCVSPQRQRLCHVAFSRRPENAGTENFHIVEERGRS